jgi:hypothetical protein
MTNNERKAGLAFSPENVEVGDQVHIRYWTDANPGTVVAVRRNGKEIDVQHDDYEYDESKGEKQIGHQNWKLIRDEKGPVSTFSWRKRQGKEVGYHPKGSSVSSWHSIVNPGWRYYYDWSF